ncbi:MAG: hypothetical protein Q8N05_17940 [Bacteroidota bacterium]|nr:hypothetical protein [Bacteroidota bacterium]
MYEEENRQPEFLKRPKTNPFRTPDHYFDSLEDRIMGGIEHAGKTKSPSARIIQLLKPALGLAASFTLVYLLVQYPINQFFPKNTNQSVVSAATTLYLNDDSTLNFSFIDENSLVNAIFSDEATNIPEINQDEMLAYLSSGMNDLEIYSEIQN